MVWVLVYQLFVRGNGKKLFLSVCVCKNIIFISNQIFALLCITHSGPENSKQFREKASFLLFTPVIFRRNIQKQSFFFCEIDFLENISSLLFLYHVLLLCNTYVYRKYILAKKCIASYIKNPTHYQRHTISTLKARCCLRLKKSTLKLLLLLSFQVSNSAFFEMYIISLFIYRRFLLDKMIIANFFKKKLALYLVTKKNNNVLLLL